MKLYIIHILRSLLLFISLTSIQSCNFPEISRELQDLTILYRLLGTGTENIESAEEETTSEPEEIILPLFTITYNGNGNDGGDPPQDTTEYTNGQFITILGNTGSMTLSGNSFVGWNTVADGSGDSYVAGNTLQVDGQNIVLFAQWSALPTFTVSYDGNGNDAGTVPIDGNTYLAGTNVTILGNTGLLSLTGNSFTGWNTESDGSGTDYNPSDTFVMPGANVTLYAQWESAFSITYMANGGDAGTPPNDPDFYLNGATVTVLGNPGNLTKSGRAWVGWNTAADGTGTTYTEGETFAIGAANVTLYAVFLEGILAMGSFRTGQIDCYNETELSTCGDPDFPSQDAENISFGSPYNFFNAPEDAIGEDSTDLVWKKCPIGFIGADCDTENPPTTFTLNSSIDLCETTYGTGWRLPNVLELAFILNFEGQHSRLVDKSFFPDNLSSSGTFMTTTYTTSAETSFHHISFSNGIIEQNGNPATTMNRIRCVKGSITPLEKSFTDLGDGTIRDNYTNLIWQKCHSGRMQDPTCSVNGGEPENLIWSEALQYCNNLLFAGRTWRLPNYKEGMSILDYSISSQRINLSVFPTPFGARMWTSTSRADAASSTTATVIMQTGGVFNGFIGQKNSSANMIARCVADP